VFAALFEGRLERPDGGGGGVLGNCVRAVAAHLLCNSLRFSALLLENFFVPKHLYDGTGLASNSSAHFFSFFHDSMLLPLLDAPKVAVYALDSPIAAMFEDNL